jgi:hypothetical protein
MPPRKKAVEIQEPSSPIETTVGAPVKAKREKKSSKYNVVAVITPEGIQGTFQNDTRRPLIASLPIHTSDIQFHDQPFIYDPTPPGQYDAFNANVSDPFAAESTYEPAPAEIVQHESVFMANQTVHFDCPSSVSTSIQPVHPIQSTPASAHVRKEYGPTTLLVQFETMKLSKELPSETNLACFWCCESFAGRPCIIPTHITDKTWYVYGNFCTPQCCMAYLLSEILDTHTRWERIALLNRLYGAQTNGRIYPAPSRESLQRFGGPIPIEDFREMCEKQRTRVDIHMPPMVSILASMDTKPIDFYETPLRNTFTSPHQPPLMRANEEPTGLKLRRSKPLKDKDNTLDSCLHITVKTQG